MSTLIGWTLGALIVGAMTMLAGGSVAKLAENPEAQAWHKVGAVWVLGVIVLAVLGGHLGGLGGWE